MRQSASRPRHRRRPVLSPIRAVGEPPQPHLYRRFSARDAGALVAVLLDTTVDPKQV